MIAFAPAFEKHFPQGADLSAAEDSTAEEWPLVEAAEYLCQRGQLAVWLDANEDVRHFLRSALFEAEPEVQAAESAEGAGTGAGEAEEPPLRPLPPAPLPGATELEVCSRWRKAREDAMELWAQE